MSPGQPGGSEPRTAGVFVSSVIGTFGSETCCLAQRFLVVTLAVPTWLQKPQDSQLEEGRPGYLHCLTQATPKPTVIWYRNQMLISEVRNAPFGQWEFPYSLSVPAPELSYPRGCPPGEVRVAFGISLFLLKSVLQDSRFEVSKNGTLRINSVEVYDGTLYRCVSSTPAGSIEAQARVQVLGKSADVTCWEDAWSVRAEEWWEGAAGTALASLPASVPPLLLPHSTRKTQVHAPASATAVHGV